MRLCRHSSALARGTYCNVPCVPGVLWLQVAAFDMAAPGTLPSINAFIVQQAVRAGVALGGDIQPVSAFERKHYMYADLPHGYQITQNHVRAVVVYICLLACAAIASRRVTMALALVLVSAPLCAAGDLLWMFLCETTRGASCERRSARGWTSIAFSWRSTQERATTRCIETTHWLTSIGALSR